MTFAGAVPRTFIGALAVSAIAKPLVSFIEDGKGLQILGEIIIVLLC